MRISGAPSTGSWVRASFVNQRPKRLNLLEKSQVFPSDPLIDGIAGWPGILRPDNRDGRSTKRRAAHPFGRDRSGRANGLTRTQQVLSANFMLTKSVLSQEYRRLAAAFERIFGATIFFGTESTRKHARVIQRSRFNFLSEAQIWYNRDPDQEVLSADFENVIVLSDEFYNEVIAHPIPADIEAAKAFGSAPAVLDLFMWLTYRCFTAKSEERIPLFGDFGLTAQLGSVEYSRPRRFRAMLEQWLGQVRAVWPECPAHICSDGQYLRLRPAKAVLPTTA